MDVTHNIRTALSAPVGIISDFINPSDPGLLREVFRSSPLSETIQGKHFVQVLDHVLLEHLHHDIAQLPAPADREGYHGEDHTQYWLMGLVDALYIEKLIIDIAEPNIFLDFGCSSGRVLRHFSGRQPFSVHGCDINSKSIHFVRSHIPQAVGFHNTIYPPLPYESSSVDMIYAGSIFTHISDFEEAWLMEFRRILRPGGRAFITVHTERTWGLLKSQKQMIAKTLASPHSARGLDYFVPNVCPDFFCRETFGDRCVLTRLDYPVNNTNVFHSKEYISNRWSRIISVEEIVEKAHGPYQDGVLLRKY